MASTPETFAIAVEFHQAGRLLEAEQLYRDILRAEPRHADALHLLGVIAHQSGQHETAIDLISQSINVNGSAAIAHNNLGGACRALKRFRDAVASYQRAVELDPDYADAWLNQGQALTDLGEWEQAIGSYRQAAQLRPNLASAQIGLGHAFKALGQRDEAAACFRRALEFSPHDAQLVTCLADVTKELGQITAAIALYERAIQLQPNLVVALVNLGVALKDQGQIDAAVSRYRQALALAPNVPEIHNNLGVALAERKELDAAIGWYLRAITLKPDYVDAYVNSGNVFCEQGKLDDAVSSYRAALEIQPNYAPAHANLAVALHGQGKLDEAIASYQHALQLEPTDARSLSNLGAALKTLGQLDDAVDCCRRALQLLPNDAETYNHLGNALKDQGELDEAIKCYRRAVELKPDFAGALSNLIYTRIFCPGVDASTILKEHRQWDELFGRPQATSMTAPPNSVDPARRLRIGYVSPDFRNHVVGRSLLPLFREHDHERFELFCYADVASPDELTAQFRGRTHVWRNTTGQSDAQLVELIRHDRIDILVDLTLHMAQNRLRALASKPAPVQVTFAGYPGTTGLTAIDYRLTDVYLDPPGQYDGDYAEQSIRLPDSFWCFDPLDTETVVSDLPANRNRHVTFGCLNNFCKVNKPALWLWAAILKAVDHSRLVILAGEGNHRQKLLQILCDAGINSDRITIVAHKPRSQYLRNYDQIDIGLDTFPYNGHMTSLDSFWMGVPVVTLAGATVVGRAGLCQLMNLGLPELIAGSPDQYVQIATSLAADRNRLSTLRFTLRERMRASPLMDQPRFARAIEAAYCDIWQRWCSQQSATPTVDSSQD